MTALFVLFAILPPVLTVVFAILFNTAATKENGKFLGLMTAFTRQNQNTWEFANKLAGKIFFSIGLILLIVSVLIAVIIPTLIKSDDILFYILLGWYIVCVIVVFSSIARVEIATYKKFKSLFNLNKK